MKKHIGKVMALLGCLVFMAISNVACTPKERVELVKDGKALAQIVVADKATQAAQFAASELQLHLKKITGADFEISLESKAGPGFKIFVGESSATKTKASDLVDQQYVVDIRKDAIELIGRDEQIFKKAFVEEKNGSVYSRNKPSLYSEQGTMYAVYEFLEQNCDVIWVDGSDYGTVIKPNKNLAVTLGRTQYEPFMSYRGGTISYNPSPLLWKQSNAGYKEYLAAAFKDPKNAKASWELYLARSRAGGYLASANHSFYWWYSRFWNENDKCFERKAPEYFAQGYDKLPPQLCYMHPFVIKQTVEDIRAYLDNNGYTNTYHGIGTKGPSWGKNRYCLEPMDNNSFCKCSRCAKYYERERKDDNSEHSTYWFTFVKMVAEEVKKSHPTAKISTLAYMSHEGLPTNVTLPDNVEVYFCLSGNRENPRGKLCKGQSARMEEWHKAYPNMKLGMWLYSGFPLEFAHNGNYQCVPGYFARENAKQFHFFKKMNARVGIFNCGLTGEVCQFMTFALMRNPDLEAEYLLDRYFSQYGAAAKPLKEFYNLVEERYCDTALCPKGVSRRTTAYNWLHCCPVEIVEKLEKYMNEAEKLAQTPEEKERVKLFKLSQWNWMKLGSDTYNVRMKAPMPEWTAVKIAEVPGGDIEKVEWDKIPLIKTPMYERGGNVDVSDIVGLEARFANDGKYFYLELVQKRDLSKVQISGHVCPFDDWELYMARQRAQPYRCYFADPDNRMHAASWGEVNWRQHVPSIEGCPDPAYFAKTKTILDKKNNRWIQRFSFPLDKFLDAPMKPGDTFYLTPVSVLNNKVPPKADSVFYIISAVSYSTVHTIDRSASVTLEK